MFFFNEPKIKRIARHLESQLKAYCQDRKAHLRMVNDRINRITHEGPITFSWFRAKQDFSWQFSLEYESYLRWELENVNKQIKYYSELQKFAGNIVTEVEKPSPDYDYIIERANQIKDKKVPVPTIGGDKQIELQINYFSGSNLIVDFFSGLGGLVYAPAMALASLLLIPFYAAGQSEYCGGPVFFLDTALYFSASLLKAISSVIFPLAMLRSKYETDSANVFSGELWRSLESIITLASDGLKSTETPALT